MTYYHGNDTDRRRGRSRGPTRGTRYPRRVFDRQPWVNVHDNPSSELASRQNASRWHGERRVRDHRKESEKRSHSDLYLDRRYHPTDHASQNRRGRQKAPKRATREDADESRKRVRRGEGSAPRSPRWSVETPPSQSYGDRRDKGRWTFRNQTSERVFATIKVQKEEGVRQWDSKRANFELKKTTKKPQCPVATPKIIDTEEKATASPLEPSKRSGVSTSETTRKANRVWPKKGSAGDLEVAGQRRRILKISSPKPSTPKQLHASPSNAKQAGAMKPLPRVHTKTLGGPKQQHQGSIPSENPSPPRPSHKRLRENTFPSPPTDRGILRSPKVKRTATSESVHFNAEERTLERKRDDTPEPVPNGSETVDVQARLNKASKGIAWMYKCLRAWEELFPGGQTFPSRAVMVAAFGERFQRLVEPDITEGTSTDTSEVISMPSAEGLRDQGELQNIKEMLTRHLMAQIDVELVKPELKCRDDA